MKDYERYEKLRDYKGLKNSDVAKLANIPASTFTDWKKGKSSPKLEKLKKIADVLETTTSEIKGFDEDSKESKAMKLADIVLQAKEENKVCIFASKEECSVLEQFKQLNEDQKKQIMMMCAFFLSNKDEK